MGSIEWCARTCQSFFSLAELSTRLVEELEPNSASVTPMDFDAVGKGKGKGCFVCGRPGHAAKDCKLTQGKGKGQTNGESKVYDRQERPQVARLWDRLAETKDEKSPRR